MLFRYSWPALIWSVVVLVLTLIPGSAIPEVGIFQVDKLVHFFIFGVLMILSSYALYKKSEIQGRPLNPLLITAIYSVSFGITIEFIQKFVPGRSFSLADMVANSIGVGLGYIVFVFLRKRKLV
jgi:VanZ family protein